MRALNLIASPQWAQYAELPASIRRMTARLVLVGTAGAGGGAVVMVSVLAAITGPRRPGRRSLKRSPTARAPVVSGRGAVVPDARAVGAAGVPNPPRAAPSVARRATNCLGTDSAMVGYGPGDRRLLGAHRVDRDEPVSPDAEPEGDASQRGAVPPPPPAGYRVDGPGGAARRDEVWAVGGLASFWRRFGALVIDVAVLVAVDLVLLLVGGSQALAVVLGALYWVVGDGVVGATVGKSALGLRVRGVDSTEPIGFWRGLIRYVGRIVSGFVLLIGYFWAIWDARNQTWHDKLADSLVVVDKGARAVR